MGRRDRDLLSQESPGLPEHERQECPQAEIEIPGPQDRLGNPDPGDLPQR